MVRSVVKRFPQHPLFHYCNITYHSERHHYNARYGCLLQANLAETNKDIVGLSIVELDTDSPVVTSLEVLGTPIVVILLAVPTIGSASCSCIGVYSFIHRSGRGATHLRCYPERGCAGLNHVAIEVFELELDRYGAASLEDADRTRRRTNL